MVRVSYLKSFRQWQKAAIAFTGVLFGIQLLSHHVHLVLNRTDSLPYTTFIHLPNKVPQKGDYTLLDSHWYSGKLIKQVIAVAGDQISYTSSGSLQVNDTVIASQYSQSRDGRKLTPIATQVIPEGKVFLYAPHGRSFDSRYEELGLVPVDVLQGTAYPVSGGA